MQTVLAPLPSPVQCGASSLSLSFRLHTLRCLVRLPTRCPVHPLPADSNCVGCSAQSRPEDLPGELEDVAARLEDDPLLLAEPANFDPLYSAVRHFGALGTEARDRTQEVIGEALKGATLVCKRTINAMGGSDDELAERRQLLRLAAFLQSWLVREAEKLAAEALPNAALAAAAKPKKGGKKGAAVAEKGWSWAEQRESAMVLLLNALELDLGVLWERCAAGLKWRPPLPAGLG